MVMTMKCPRSHSQLASGAPADCQAAPTMITLASATPKQPIDILTTVEGSPPRLAGPPQSPPTPLWPAVGGPPPRLACHAQSPTMSGVKAKIMNGLKAWNQVVGI